MMDKKEIIKIACSFKVEASIESAESFGGGHINDTFLVKTDDPNYKYILQKINKNVFKTPMNVINNIELLLQHLISKEETQLRTFKNNSGEPFYKDQNEDYWRMYNFVENTVSYDVIDTDDQAYEAAKAFGKLQSLTLDLNTNDFQDTIPDFHNLEKRYSKFDNVFRSAKADRITEALKEVLFVQDLRVISDKITSLMQNGQLPLRVTHNDTKLNNALMDAISGEGICVIDLDTIMPGLVLYDFGDMVRTFTSPVPEDEKDTSKVLLRKNVFEALTKGYLTNLKTVLTDAEKENLLTGAKYMILIIGLRFLTDYLENDVYFKTVYEEHNLVRARNQFALLSSLNDQEEDLQSIINKYI